MLAFGNRWMSESSSYEGGIEDERGLFACNAAQLQYEVKTQA